MSSDATSPLPPPVVVRNEFSIVELSYTTDGNRLGLVITDADSGDRVVVGAAELAALAGCSHESFRMLMRVIDDYRDTADRPRDSARRRTMVGGYGDSARRTGGPRMALVRQNSTEARRTRTAPLRRMTTSTSMPMGWS